MKVIYLIAGTYRAAGMERVLANKVNWLSGHGYEILVVTTDQRGREPAFHFDPAVRFVDLGIGYEDNNGGTFLSKLINYPYKQWRHRHRLSALLKAERADIVVSMFCNDASFLPYIKDGSRKVLEIHFSRFKRLQYGRGGLWAVADRIRYRSDMRTVRHFDKFVVLTEEDKAYWGDLANILVIPNARTFAPDPALLSDQSSRVVLAAGRYNKQKAFDRLVRAWAKLPSERIGEGWKLRIAGDGEERTALAGLVDSLGLRNSVELVAPVSDMRREYAWASIFALTSRYEGLPMVLLEAQASALPVVSMACKCGPRDVVSDGVDGILVPDGDVDAFADALNALMTDDIRRRDMSAAALLSSERYDESSVMEIWDGLFKTLSGEGGKKTVVVSAVNLRKGGTLAILRSCLEYLGTKTGEYRVVALVHRRELCDFPGIEYIEMPHCARSWTRRLWAEYVTMHRISREIAAEDGRRVWLWLSLHDTTPRVDAEHQEVYCHTSFPFMKIKAHDWLMDPKIPLFALFTKWAYRINVHRNDSLIVQQEWFADALSGLTGVERSRFRVIAPVPKVKPEACRNEAGECGTPGKTVTFLYAATPDCHKNFETLCEAAGMLESRLGAGRFKVVLTISGRENRYSRWLYKRWGGVRSIDFHGFMSRDELFANYAAADCFVCPSRVETWCLPISEYVSVHPGGRLLLADLPYAHETSGNDAVFFAVCDAAALADRMEEIVERR